jgi:hypothetical protein
MSKERVCPPKVQNVAHIMFLLSEEPVRHRTSAGEIDRRECTCVFKRLREEIYENLENWNAPFVIRRARGLEQYMAQWPQAQSLRVFYMCLLPLTYSELASEQEYKVVLIPLFLEQQSIYKRCSFMTRSTQVDV